MTRREVRWLTAAAMAVGMLIGAAMACFVYSTAAMAEDEMTYDCWIMCQPESEVYIRESPSKRGRVIGAAACGERMRTDIRERNGWLHLVDVGNETGEGWVYSGYVVYQEPREIGAEMVVTGGRRIACRNSIGGKLIRWAKRGTTVTVYLTDGEWAVTDRGYIMMEYLEERPE